MPKNFLTYPPTKAWHLHYPHCPRWHITQCWPRQIQTNSQIIFQYEFVCGLWANIAQVIFLCNVEQARSRQYFVSNSPARRLLRALGQHCTSNFPQQCYLTAYLDNFGQTIFLCNPRSLSDNIAQGFYLCNGCSKSIKTTLNEVFSYAMLFGASKTTLHKVFPMKCFSCAGNTRGTILHR